MQNYQMLINGAWVSATSGATFESRDPATGELIAQVPRGSTTDIERAVTSARQAFPAWSRLEPRVRGEWLHKLGVAIREQLDDLAVLESRDNGKPLRQAKTDVEIAARYFIYYAGIADKIRGSAFPVSASIMNLVLREPLGVYGSIIPWNYPLQILCRTVAPALVVGNTVVIKPAEETPVTALFFGQLCQNVGLPPGVVNIITGYGIEAGRALAQHPGIDGLSFTGSPSVGTEVMQNAARNIVPVVLELGGKSPNIVFHDAAISRAVPAIVNAILQNAGQTCSAGSRLIIHEDIYEEVVTAITEKFERAKMGAGLGDPDVGPLISEKQLKRVETLTATALTDGGTLRVGGNRLNGTPGYFFTPTLITNVSMHSAAVQEEIFGPVLIVHTFQDEAEAYELANGTSYGLVAGVWTQNIDRALRAIHAVSAGQIFVNSYGAGGGIEMPFGGMKRSGFGREKGLESLAHYTKVKNVAMSFLESSQDDFPLNIEG